ncbi:MAG: ferritin-like domain-containing protein [Ginsengibacter sp.]
MSNKLKEDEPTILENVGRPLSRRNFFGILGAGSAMVVVAASCRKEMHGNPGHGQGNGGVNLGSGDVGILNYAYALEQLEAAFYTQVVKTPYHGISAMEKSYLTDIMYHEVAHREFLKAALGSMAIPGLKVDFSKVDFWSRDSVLGTSKAFEDLGVSAYNGAGQLLVNPDYLTIAGKIVSVEARHAAWIRDIIGANTFAGMDVVDMNGLDVARNPNAVLAIAGTYIKTKIDASNLPTS